MLLELLTNNSLLELLKYKAPAIRVLPSLSDEGADPLAPKYLSSKLSKEAAALVADEDADDAELAPAVAEFPAAVAEAAASLAFVVAVSLCPEAVDADVAASPAFVVAVSL